MLKKNISDIIIYFGISATIIKYFPFFRNQKPIVMQAVKIDGNAIKYASNNLKNDREIIMSAITFSKDRDYNLIRDPFEIVDEKYRIDHEIVLASMSNLCLEFIHIDDRLKKDKKFILKFLKSYDELSWQFFSLDYKFKNDKEVILRALSFTDHKTHSSWHFENINKDLKSNREFVLDAVKINGYVINC